MPKPKPQPKKPTARAATKATHKKEASWQDRFLEIFAMSLNVALAAMGAGINRATAYKERDKNAEFARGWDDAKAAAIERLEAVAFERAQKMSDTLLIFLLKSHKPERYRERYEAVTTNVNIDWDDLTDDELAKIAAGEHPTTVLANRRR